MECSRVEYHDVARATGDLGDAAMRPVGGGAVGDELFHTIERWSCGAELSEPLIRFDQAVEETPDGEESKRVGVHHHVAVDVAKRPNLSPVDHSISRCENLASPMRSGHGHRWPRSSVDDIEEDKREETPRSSSPTTIGSSLCQRW